MSDANGTAKRSPGKPFRPGESGNPGGRPKAYREVDALARSYTTEAIKTLARLMRESGDEKIQLLAAVALLDRAWGRPTQAVNVARITATVSEERVTQAFESAGELPEKQA